MKKQKLLRISEASELLGVHPNTLRKWDKNGTLQSVRFGVREDRRYSIDSLLKLVNEKKKNT